MLRISQKPIPGSRLVGTIENSGRTKEKREG